MIFEWENKILDQVKILFRLQELLTNQWESHWSSEDHADFWRMSKS